MAKYRHTYRTFIEVSVETEHEDDDAAFDEDESHALVEEFLNTLPMGLGPNRIIADASVDGMGPIEIRNLDEDRATYTTDEP